MRTRSGFLVIVAVAASGIGCAKPVHFPREPLKMPARGDAFRSFDTDGDGQADFFTYAAADGRVNRIGYDRDHDGEAEKVVPLDAIPAADCRHLVMILDGVGYELVREYYEQGHLRLFHPPSLVIAPYPTLTDPCLEDIFGYVPVAGFEAVYFDHDKNRVAGGSRDYLTGTNQPYNRLLQYRANLIWDALGYLFPWEVYGKELNDAKRGWDKRGSHEFAAYFVSSAGVGTRMGGHGHRMCLREAERLVRQVVQETQGLVKVTLLADHGHSYTQGQRAPIAAHLKQRGWRLRSTLRGPDDVVYIRFGLETYASFATRRPAALAGDLVGCEGVELASYVADEKRPDEAVTVLDANGGRATVLRRGGRYAYRIEAGDPLKLRDVLSDLAGDEAGFYDADALLAATARHTYPAPLQRLWRAHFALVENPPDVIVSLANGYFSGSGFFAGGVDVASTHGSLNYDNSATFIMSTAGPLPEVLRSGDVPAAMEKLLGRPWPLGR